MTGRLLLVTGLLCAVFAGCASKTTRIIESRNYNGKFLCDGSRQVQVRFTPFKAELESEGTTAEMAQQPTADGFLYTAGRQSLRASGSEATWTDDRGASHHCRDITSLNGNSINLPSPAAR